MGVLYIFAVFSATCLVLTTAKNYTVPGYTEPRNEFTAEAEFWRTYEVLESIPTDIPKDARRVYLRWNTISDITTEAFRDFSSLEVLDISSNDVDTVHNEAFVGLANLKELWLYDNFISDVSQDTFRGLDSLEELWLGRNELQHITNTTFTELDTLVFLQLSDCQINSIEDSTFSSQNRLQVLWLHVNGLTDLRPAMFKGLTSLRVLTLHSNRLTTIGRDVFRDLPRPLELGLKFNPLLECDGRLCWLQDEERAGRISWYTTEPSLLDDSRIVHSPDCPDLDGWDTWKCPKIVADCGIPPARPHSRRIGRHFLEGDEVYYLCDECYTGGGISVCLSEGMWSNPMECRAITCPHPGFPPYTERYVPMTSYSCGTRITYRCNQGYRLLGNSTLTCGKDGRFYGSFFHCERGSFYWNFG